MTGKTLAILLATAAFPFAAQAQDAATTPQQTQPPTVMQQDGAAPAQGIGSTNAQIQPVQPTTDGVPATDGQVGAPGTNVTQDTTPLATEPAGSAGTMAATGMDADGPFVTVPATGAWRVADLTGKAVYGSDGESIGDINDVLVNAEGEVAAVIIGVGGFLGIGEKDVAVSMEALEFGPGDGISQADAGIATTTGVPGSGAMDSTGAVATDPLTSGGTALNPNNDQVGTTTVAPNSTDLAADGGVPVVGNDGLPDRIILSVTREQLEAAPEFAGIGAANIAQ